MAPELSRVRRELRSGSQITETRTFGFAVRIGAPVARAAGVLAYVAPVCDIGGTGRLTLKAVAVRRGLELGAGSGAFFGQATTMRLS